MSTEKLIVLANNFLNFIEGNCNVGSAGALSEEKESVSVLLILLQLERLSLKTFPPLT